MKNVTILFIVNGFFKSFCWSDLLNACIAPDGLPLSMAPNKHMSPDSGLDSMVNPYLHNMIKLVVDPHQTIRFNPTIYGKVN